MTDQPTPAEIRQAVAFGKQAAVRELLDALAKARPRREGWRLVYEGDDTMPTSMRWSSDMNAVQCNGWDAAVKVVREYRVEGEPKR